MGIGIYNVSNNISETARDIVNQDRAGRIADSVLRQTVAAAQNALSRARGPHPCEKDPETGKCADVTCPPGQECDPETGLCVSSGPDNADHNYPSISAEADYRRPSMFLAPQNQIKAQDSLGNPISSVSRVKTLVDSSHIYSARSPSWTAITLQSPDNDGYAHLPGLGWIWHNSSKNQENVPRMAYKAMRRMYDPIRYSSGHIWFHSQDSLYDEGGGPTSELMYFNKVQRSGLLEGVSIDATHKIFDIHTPGDVQNRITQTSLGQVMVERIQLTNWSDKISANHGNTGFPDGEFYTQPGPGEYIYFPYLMAGRNFTFVKANTPEDLPWFWNQEFRNDVQVVKESARQSYYTRGLFDGLRGDVISDLDGRAFVDLVHECNMPFFASETEQMEFGTHLSADIKVVSNYVTNRFKLDTSPETSRINIYRHSRDFTDPVDCQVSDYDLAFTSRNIESFEKIYEDYRTQFPIVTNIRFQTNQGSRIAELFRKYGMDKYFLDFIMEDGVGGQTKRFSGPENLNSHLFGQVLDQKHSMKTSRGAMVDSLLSDSEGLLYSLGPDAPEIQAATSASGRDDFNFATTSWAAYNNQLSIDQGGSLINDGATYLDKLPTVDLVWWLKNHLTVEQMSAIEDRNFPLGVFPKHKDLRPKSDYTLFVNELNKVIFSQKLGDMVLGTTGHSGDSPGQWGLDEFDIDKKLFRSFQDILNGEKAYSETVAYRVSKHLVTKSGNSRIVDPEPVQNFFFFDSDVVQEINFLDNQVSYGKTYEYRIYAYNVVVGNRYKYKLLDKNLVSILNTDSPKTTTQQLREVTGQTHVNLIGHFRDITGGTGMPNNYTIDLDVHNMPYIALVQVPYFKQEVLIIDKPPIFPTVDVVPYKDDHTRIRISLMANGGEYLLEPIGLKPKSKDYVGDENLIADMRKAQGNRRKIHYKHDDPPRFYQAFRTTMPPRSYSDFAGAKMWTYESFGSSVSVNHTIEPNKKYYYTFRSKDDAGISNPTEVYCIEMVVVQDGMYLDISEYEFPKKEVITKKNFSSCVLVTPSINQRVFNIGKWTLDTAGDHIAERLQSFSKFNPEASLGVYQGDESLWGKKFKFRFTSKASGKKMDVNAVFKQTKEGYKLTQVDEQHTKDDVTECAPPGPRKFTSPEKEKEKERSKKDDSAAKEKTDSGRREEKQKMCEHECRKIAENKGQTPEEKRKIMIECMMAKGCAPTQDPKDEKQDYKQTECEKLCKEKTKNSPHKYQACLEHYGCTEEQKKAESAKAKQEEKKEPEGMPKDDVEADARKEEMEKMRQHEEAEKAMNEASDSLTEEEKKKMEHAHQLCMDRCRKIIIQRRGISPDSEKFEPLLRECMQHCMGSDKYA